MMTARLQARLLTNVLDYGGRRVPNLPVLKRTSFTHDQGPIPGPALAPPLPRRTKLWELAETLHCSIIGTCLSTAELRHILIQLKISGIESAVDHELHGFGVAHAGKRDLGAKLLQKALDRRHERAIKRFAAAGDVETVRSLWRAALNGGDIPGSYWAVMTHPQTDDALIKQTFGDVHMLSHLVGAANRADIRRLRQLESENAELADELRGAQRQIREGSSARDQLIGRLNDLLAERSQTSQPPANDTDDAVSALEQVVRDLNAKLAREIARRQSGETRVAMLSSALAEKELQLQIFAKEREALQHEVDTIEARFSTDVPERVTDDLVGPELKATSILYVGGRPNQIPLLRELIEDAGGTFLHHDGGIEHSLTKLPGLISRADIVLFPTDCVSHSAMTVVKRACQQGGKTYLPLRSAGLTSLMAALSTLPRSRL